MREFGSDFHYCTDIYSSMNSFLERNISFYANGRQPLLHLIDVYGWKRIWIPSYFCYDVISSVRNSGIEIKFYDDSPMTDDIDVISRIEFDTGDVILRMNYFGLRRWRTGENILVPVIEDHSHDLFGEWMKRSNADWVIASLRKTLPIPEGGILWSPKGLSLPQIQPTTLDNELLSFKRLSAMLLKKLYLSGENISKENFRNLYQETEKSLEVLPLCGMSDCCRLLFNSININEWYTIKKANWQILSGMIKDTIEYLIPEDLKHNYPFSLVLKFATKKQRDVVKCRLIKKQVYPAVLWDIPDDQTKASELSRKLLSIHCDARYDSRDMEQLGRIILNNSKNSGSN
jgi:hypothetical protein